jgi:hypothetical protein
MFDPTPQDNSLEMRDAPDANTSVDGLALFANVSRSNIEDYRYVLYQINALTDVCDTLLWARASNTDAVVELQDLELGCLQEFRGKCFGFLVNTFSMFHLHSHV